MMKKNSWLFLVLFNVAGFAQPNTLQQPSVPPDSITTIASSLYQPHSFLRRVLMGNNYREEWQTPVSLPVFYFSSSGFRIKELGGGMQTKSLHLVDSNGKEWSLRSVDKDVTQAIPPGLRNRLTRRSSQDLISASFPYGAPIAGQLVNAAGVKAAKPKVVFVADDSALGEFRSVFAHTICTLEERDPGFDSTDGIEDVAQNIHSSTLYKVQQPLLLKARLLDILMADWDRHADNWRWGLKDSAGLRYYFAIPRDRDWVFFKTGGWVPKLVQLTGAMRCFINFGSEVEKVKDLSWKAWALDKAFLNEMDASNWEAAIKEVQALLTDSAITAAVQTLPSSIFAIDGEKFIETLKSRRNDLHKGVMKYYRFLSEEVLINGSDEEEKFVLSSINDTLVVSVYRIGELPKKIYERRFSPTETYFLTLNGLGGNDVFEVAENAKSKIKIKINGGNGQDKYDIRGNLQVKINDPTTAD